MKPKGTGLGGAKPGCCTRKVVRRATTTRTRPFQLNTRKTGFGLARPGGVVRRIVKK